MNKLFEVPYNWVKGRKGVLNMQKKMDRSIINIAKQEEFDIIDDLYCIEATIKEKLETITYLRECFYGKEATTRHASAARRLQRVSTMFKRT